MEEHLEKKIILSLMTVTKRCSLLPLVVNGKQLQLQLVLVAWCCHEE